MFLFSFANKFVYISDSRFFIFKFSFKQLNSEATAFQRTFSAEVTRCNEMERKLRYIETQIVKEGVNIDELIDIPLAPLPKEMVDLEAALDKMDCELREINANAEVYIYKDRGSRSNYYNPIVVFFK